MKSTTYAAIISSSYALLGVIYIFFSTAIAAETALDTAELAQRELVKGSLFVLCTATFIFFFSRALFARTASAAADAAASREALLSAQHRATSGIFAAGLAHDLQNLLMVMSFGVEELRENASETPDSSIVRDMEAALKQATALTDRIARSSNPPPLVPEETDIIEIVARAVDLIRPSARARRADIKLDSPETLVADVYPALIEQLTVNLVLNAVEAISEGGAILVKVYRTPDRTVVEVHDDGPGLPEGEDIFREFWTTKPDGTGLGLVSVRICAEAHGGEVIAEESPLGGALVRVLLSSAVEQPLDPSGR